LCLEVAKYCNTKERTLLDTEGTKTLEFTMEGIESAFSWRNEGILFTMKNLIKFFNNMTKSRNLIRGWLVDKYKYFKVKALSQPNRTYFYQIISTIISMICKKIGKENDQRFRKESFNFIHHIIKAKASDGAR